MYLHQKLKHLSWLYFVFVWCTNICKSDTINIQNKFAIEDISTFGLYHLDCTVSPELTSNAAKQYDIVVDPLLNDIIKFIVEFKLLYNWRA